jgi:hypothetical protein
MEVRMPSPLLAVVAALLCGPCRLVAAYASPKTLEKTWTVEFELGPGEIYNEWIDLPMPEGKFVIEAFNADIVVCLACLVAQLPDGQVANNCGLCSVPNSAITPR